MEDSETEAEVDNEDPEEVKNIVPVRALKKSFTFEGSVTLYFIGTKIFQITWTSGQEGSVTKSSALAAIPPLRKVGPRLMVMLENLEAVGQFDL